MHSENVTIGCGCTGVLLVIVFVILQIVLGGLWRTEFTWSPPAPAASATTQAVEAPFEVKLNASHWVWGLVKGSQPDVQQAVNGFVQPGEQVKEIRVVFRHSFVDNVLALVTLGIYTPVTVDVKGKVARAAEPAR